MTSKIVQGALAGAVAIAVASCATTTKIVTEEPGATVTLIDAKGDKKPLGKTPLTHESKVWIWEKEKIEVSQGGQTKVVELSRSEIDLLPTGGAVALTVCTGVGICVGLPLFLAGGLKFPEETKVVFDKKTSSFIRVPEATMTVAATDGAQRF
jgi:hypothetical protein